MGWSGLGPGEMANYAMHYALMIYACESAHKEVQGVFGGVLLNWIRTGFLTFPGLESEFWTHHL